VGMLTALPAKPLISGKPLLEHDPRHPRPEIVANDLDAVLVGFAEQREAEMSMEGIESVLTGGVMALSAVHPRSLARASNASYSPRPIPRR
jgi:hypothetical protein